MAGELGQLMLGIDTRIRLIWFIGILALNAFATLEISLLVFLVLMCITVYMVILKKVKIVFPIIIITYCFVWHLISNFNNPLATSALLTIPPILIGYLVLLVFCNRQSILDLTKSICWYFSWLPKKRLTGLFKKVYIALSALLVIGDEFKRSWILCNNRFSRNGYDIFVWLSIFSIDFLRRIIIKLQMDTVNLDLRVIKTVPSAMIASSFPKSRWKYVWQLAATVFLFSFLIMANSGYFPFLPRLEVGH